MTVLENLIAELEQEAVTTRKMLSIVPEDKFGWKPHPKSMDLKTLAVHVAELNTWIPMALHTDELDFAKSEYKQSPISTTKELVEYFEKNLAEATPQLKAADAGKFDEQWLLRTGDTIHVDTTRYGMIRVAMSQTIHHRAQLGVFLRLLNIPIPGSYGPSADEMGF